MESAEQYRVRVKDLAEDTIEKYWIPLWTHVPMESMDKETVELFFKIGTLPDSECEKVVTELVEKKDFAACLIHKSMLTRFQVKMTYKVQLWLIATCESPGDSVMKFAYIKYKMHQKGIDYLDFNNFSIHVFPMGFPSAESMQWLWDCQKLRAETNEEIREMPGTGNLLDCPIAYTSFS